MISAPQATRAQQASDTATVIDLALRGLPRMLDPERRLFCYTLRQADGSMVREGISPRYTMMTLLGLHRLEQSGQKSSVEILPILEGMIDDTRWIEGMGDLGCLLWTCAVIAPERYAGLAKKVDAPNAPQRFQDGRDGITMELAWYLTGLAYGLNLGDSSLRYLEAPAAETYARLTANQGAKGVFGHQAKAQSIKGMLRGKVGSFADQVYPIYAFSQYAKCTEGREPLGRALQCARMICEYQGPFGEWCWHYDSASGKLVESYPIYSVHQDGMAPMALFALGDVTGEDFTAWLAKGLKWIGGSNDLRVDMRSQEEAVIWRNFYLPTADRYLRQVPGLGGASRPVAIEKLKVNHECRPYELGWALYGLAGRSLG